MGGVCCTVFIREAAAAKDCGFLGGGVARGARATGDRRLISDPFLPRLWRVRGGFGHRDKLPGIYSGEMSGPLCSLARGICC